METEIQRRMRWVELFLKVRNASIVCLRCGISRPTLRKWVRRFQENGLDGLKAESKRPKSSPSASFRTGIVNGFGNCALLALVPVEFKTN
jgi:transposase-like protein